jgi:hypothetical protein
MHVVKGDLNGYSPGWGLEHRAINPVSVKNLTAIETSTIVKLLRPYVPVGMKRARRRRRSNTVAHHDSNFKLNVIVEFEVHTHTGGQLY